MTHKKRTKRWIKEGNEALMFYMKNRHLLKKTHFWLLKIAAHPSFLIFAVIMS